MTRSRMNGREVLVRAGLFDGTSSFGVGFDGSEFSSFDALSGYDIFTALSFSLTSSLASGVLMRS